MTTLWYLYCTLLTLSLVSPHHNAKLGGSVIGHTLGVSIDDVPEYSGSSKEGGWTAGGRGIMDALNRPQIGQTYRRIMIHDFFSSFPLSSSTSSHWHGPPTADRRPIHSGADPWQATEALTGRQAN